MRDEPTGRLERFPTRRTGRVAVRGPEDPSAVGALWMALHGYGQLAAPFLEGMRALDDGTRLLVAPEALSRFYDARSPLERHAEAAVGASWMTREARLDEIEDQATWLDVVHGAFAARLPAGTPLVVLGFSQGAAAAARWLARGHVRAAHLVCWGAGLPPDVPIGPGSALGGTRCTLVVGDRDRFVTPAQVEAERARLEAAGFAHRFVTFTGGHRLDDATLRRVADGVPG